MPPTDCGAGKGRAAQEDAERESCRQNELKFNERKTSSSRGDADLSQHWAEAPALVAFVRAIGLKAGDTQRLAISGPDGQTIADHAEKPIDRNKAQFTLFVGKKRPGARWPGGTYRASYTVSHDGRVVLEHGFVLSF